MTYRTALILLAAAFAALIATLAAVAAGYLSRRDQAAWPQAVVRAATAFAATLTLIALLVTTMYNMIQ